MTDLNVINALTNYKVLASSFLLIFYYLENSVLEVLSKFSTSQNTANIYGSGAGSYL